MYFRSFSHIISGFQLWCLDSCKKSPNLLIKTLVLVLTLSSHEHVRTLWGICEDRLSEKCVRNLWETCEECVRNLWEMCEEPVRTVWGVREEPGSSHVPLNGNMSGHCDSGRDIVWNLWGTCEEYIWGCSVRNTWDPFKKILCKYCTCWKCIWMFLSQQGLQTRRPCIFVTVYIMCWNFVSENWQKN